MPKTTAKQFLERLQRSQLVPRDVLRENLLALKRESNDALPSDALEVANYLIRRGLLTHWQCEKLLAGKSRGFFLGDLKLLDHICNGGMSSVYLVEDLSCHENRAIKVFPKSRLKQASYLARFYLEAKATVSLDHPNIVRAFGLQRQDDLHYLVMEYVRGRDLQVLVSEDGALDYVQAADVIAQAAIGFEFAHRRGLIHRDVKPANLLVDENGTVKILDLGLALYENDEASLTIAHQENVLGTADYLAPEQALDSHTVDGRADIYGLGCTLYFALTGHPPFPHGSIARRILAHQQRLPDSISNDRPDCPRELRLICERMYQKDPDVRYQSCLEVASVLQRWIAAQKSAAPATAAAMHDGGDSRPSLPDTPRRSHRRSARRAASPGRRDDDTISSRDAETVVSRKSSLARRPPVQSAAAEVRVSPEIPADSVVNHASRTSRRWPKISLSRKGIWGGGRRLVAWSMIGLGIAVVGSLAAWQLVP
jgi:serine/threonine-protein kinase